MGHNQAIGAIAHRQCRLIWLILHHTVRYEERGPAGAMGFGDDGGCEVQRLTKTLCDWIDPGKNLDAVGAILNLPADAFGGLRG
jgi:hypothetical protein